MARGNRREAIVLDDEDLESLRKNDWRKRVIGAGGPPEHDRAGGVDLRAAQDGQRRAVCGTDRQVKETLLDSRGCLD